MPIPPDAKVLTLDKTQTMNFSSVGISWIGQAPVNGIALQIRVQDAESGTWSDWTELTVNRDVVPNADSPEIRQGSDPFWFGTSTGVEVAITVVPGTDVSDLKLTLIDPKKVTQDSAAQSAPTSSAGAAAPMPEVYSRASWGADESKMGWTPQYLPTMKAATLHHSADSNNYSAADVPGLMRSIYQYQAVTLGWGDIGYNVVVDKFGRAWEGRAGGLDKMVVGAHAGGFNRYTFGVSMLGNYDLVSVPDAVKQKVAQLISWKFGLFGVDPTGQTQLTQYGGAGTTAKYTDGTTVTVNKIFGHRDVGNTVCPGQYGYAALPWIRDRVEQLYPQYSTTSYDPQGALEASAPDSKSIAVNGWAFDESALFSPVNVMVTIDGAVAGILAADKPRPELASYGIPGNHGFTGTFAASSGTRNVCLFVFNIGAGNDVLSSCVQVIVPPGKNEDPVGAVNATESWDQVRFDGWAYDPSDPAASISVMVQSNGANQVFTGAAGPRPELVYYGIPGNHGFSGSFQLPKASSTNVCVFAFNIGTGNSKTIDCRAVNITYWNPRASLTLTRSGSSVIADGWAFDQDSLAAPVTVMLTVDGKVAAFTAATSSRSELAYYGIPGDHGFKVPINAPKGSSVCLFAFNIGVGSDVLSQCSVA